MNQKIKAGSKSTPFLVTATENSTARTEARAPRPLSAEQEARDMLERMGVEDAQSFSSGEVVELANLIAEARRYYTKRARWARRIRCDVCGGTGGDTDIGPCINCDSEGLVEPEMITTPWHPGPHRCPECGMYGGEHAYNCPRK